MSFLKKLVGDSKPEIDEEAVPCPHTALVPRWDSNEDMGKMDRVSTYLCTACNESFGREEGERLLPGGVHF